MGKIPVMMLSAQFSEENGGRLAAGSVVSVDASTARRWVQLGVAMTDVPLPPEPVATVAWPLVGLRDSENKPMRPPMQTATVDLRPSAWRSRWSWASQAFAIVGKAQGMARGYFSGVGGGKHPGYAHTGLGVA